MKLSKVSSVTFAVVLLGAADYAAQGLKSNGKTNMRHRELSDEEASSTEGPPFGHFIGTVQTEWLDPAERGFPHGEHDRDMMLLKDFSFEDSHGCIWTAPAGFIIDGASIPSFLWGPVIGTPFVVDFRRATVIHDYYCANHQLTRHQDLHNVFYESMRADDVDHDRASLLADVVHLFNVWEDPPGLENPPCPKVD